MVNKILSIIVAIAFGVASAATIPEPATPTDETVVFVCIELDTPLSQIKLGYPVSLRCIVDGMEEPYHIQWQHSYDKEEWADVSCEEEVYEFILTEENAGTYYRVIVSH